jgi:hypothetical protein
MRDSASSRPSTARRSAASLSFRFGESASASWLNCSTFPCTSELRWLCEKNGSSFRRGDLSGVRSGVEGDCMSGCRLILSGDAGWRGVAGDDGAKDGDSMDGVGRVHSQRNMSNKICHHHAEKGELSYGDMYLK